MNRWRWHPGAAEALAYVLTYAESPYYRMIAQNWAIGL
jgi:hypothetical protein